MRLHRILPFVSGFACGLLTLFAVKKTTVIRQSEQCDIESCSRFQALKNVAEPAAEPVAEPAAATKVGRILCWISTTEKYKKRALLVKQTWGKRCDILLFMSPQSDQELPTVVLPVPDGRPSLWGKTVEAWKYIYSNYLEQADWFYKADDDTYAVMENMRQYLSELDPTMPHYLGFAFKNNIIPSGFLSGGAGYILTREAIRRFVEVGMKAKKPLCNTDVQGPDDWNVGLCMQKLNISLSDTRDHDGRLRFLPWKLDQLLEGRTGMNLAQHTYPQGFNCCSPGAISFHYLKDTQPLIYEYLIYGLQRPNGNAGGPSISLE